MSAQIFRSGKRAKTLSVDLSLAGLVPEPSAPHAAELQGWGPRERSFCQSKGAAMRFLLLLMLVLGSVGTKALADAPIVHTQNGDVLGVLQGSVESFKALPFAAPPVGDLRWKPPQDPANWLGIRDGSKFSSSCPQRLGGRIIGSEDCLYLNVFRPQGARKLPVFVFIHGGHNSVESAGLTQNGVAVYDGSSFAQNSSVVVVTINYRLGALGFIAHPALSEESGYQKSGNYGYMDQLRALKWVNSNIAAFGGDPDNVTLLGRSSGGGGILVMMVSPLARGLFHRAIIHSGQFATHQNLTNAHNTGKTLSTKLNCESSSDDSQKLQCMRNKSATEIVLAMPGGHAAGSVDGPKLFLPVVDGRILRDFPLDIIRRQEHNRVPVLIGNVAEETSSIYYDDSKDIHTEEQYKNAVKTNYGEPLAEKLLTLYPASDYDTPRQAYNAISADRWFVCPAQQLVQAVSASQMEFVGRFLFTHGFSGPKTSPRGDPLPAFYGASHGNDLQTMFGSFGALALTPALDDLTLKEKFQTTWANFAKSDNPGSFWSRYNPALDNYVDFNVPTLSKTQLRTKQCDFWLPPDKPPLEVPEIGVTARPSIVNEVGLLPLEFSIGGNR